MVINVSVCMCMCVYACYIYIYMCVCMYDYVSVSVCVCVSVCVYIHGRITLMSDFLLFSPAQHQQDDKKEGDKMADVWSGISVNEALFEPLFQAVSEINYGWST